MKPEPLSYVLDPHDLVVARNWADVALVWWAVVFLTALCTHP